VADGRAQADLAATWCLFLLGGLPKEFVYIFPLMAGLVARLEGRLRPCLSSLAMLAVVMGPVCLPAERAPHPPQSAEYPAQTHLWNATYFLIPVLYRNLGFPEFVGLAALVFSLGSHCLAASGALSALACEALAWLR